MLSFTCKLLELVMLHIYDTACKKFQRKKEPPFSNTIYVREFWNTLCAAPFAVVAALRMFTCDTAFADTYGMMLVLGLIIILNHAVFAVDLIFEYMPMAFFTYYTYTNGMYSDMSIVTAWYFLLAFIILTIDYVCDLGFLHSIWHILIATAYDSAFAEKMNMERLRMTLGL